MGCSLLKRALTKRTALSTLLSGCAQEGETQMFGFSPTAGLFALVFSSLLRFDHPMLSADGRPKPPQPGHTLEELTAGREWVPAASAFQGDGTLDQRAFREEHADTVRWMLKDQIAEKSAPSGIYLIPQGSCSTNLGVTHDLFGGGSTLDELTKTSTAIYSGSIVYGGDCDLRRGPGYGGGRSRHERHRSGQVKPSKIDFLARNRPVTPMVTGMSGTMGRRAR
jgi:hypothetical protein